MPLQCSRKCPPRTAQANIPIHSGKEIGVAATKTFTHQLIALLTYITKLNKDLEGIQEELSKLPELITDLLKLEPEIVQMAQKIMDTQHIMYLGRNQLYPLLLRVL